MNIPILSAYRYKMEEPLPVNFSPTYVGEKLVNILNQQKGSSVFRNRELMNCVKYYIQECSVDYTKMSGGEAINFVRRKRTDIPLCINCKKAPTKYNNNAKDYLKSCSYKCAAQNSNTKDKRRRTNIKKYGTTNVLNSAVIVSQVKRNNLKKHGVEYYCQSKEYKEKATSIRHKSSFNKIMKRFSHLVTPLFDVTNYKGNGSGKFYKWKCNRCKQEFEGDFHSQGPQRPCCPKCDKNYSDLELVIKEFFNKNNINYIKGNRSVLKGKEIDFFIKEKNIGIEINSLFYHGENYGIFKNYHVSKTELCESQNIQLIHIFTDEIKNKKSIIFNRLKSILNITRYKIYARKCNITLITAKKANKFLSKYHLYGEDRSSVRLGLFYKNRLVGVMTFGKLRYATGKRHTEGEWELIRFCTLGNFKIIGGANKLFTHFLKQYTPLTVYSYADRRWSTTLSNVYTKLGFILEGKTNPNYWYTKNFNSRIHRISFQKHRLPQKLANFDANKTEKENMKEHGYFRVWDCGNLKFKYNCTSP